MTHRGAKSFLVEYSYAGSDWLTEVWADDWEDARRKLRALQTNARLIGEKVVQVKVPGWLERVYKLRDALGREPGTSPKPLQSPVTRDVGPVGDLPREVAMLKNALSVLVGAFPEVEPSVAYQPVRDCFTRLNALAERESPTTNSVTDTPRTNAALKDAERRVESLIQLSRQLERENASMRKTLGEPPTENSSRG